MVANATRSGLIGLLFIALGIGCGAPVVPPPTTTPTVAAVPTAEPPAPLQTDEVVLAELPAGADRCSVLHPSRIPAAARDAFDRLFAMDRTTTANAHPAALEVRARKGTSRWHRVVGSSETVTELRSASPEIRGGQRCPTCTAPTLSEAPGGIVLASHPWSGLAEGVEAECASRTRADEVLFVTWKRWGSAGWLSVVVTEGGLQLFSSVTSLETPPYALPVYDPDPNFQTTNFPMPTRLTTALRVVERVAPWGASEEPEQVTLSMTFDQLVALAPHRLAPWSPEPRPTTLDALLLAARSLKWHVRDPAVRAQAGAALLDSPLLDGNERGAEDLALQRFEYLVDLGRLDEATALAGARERHVVGGGRPSSFWRTQKLFALAFQGQNVEEYALAHRFACSPEGAAALDRNLAAFTRFNDFGRHHRYESQCPLPVLPEPESGPDERGVTHPTPVPLAQVDQLTEPLPIPNGAAALRCAEPLSPEPGWWPIVEEAGTRYVQRSLQREPLELALRSLPEEQECEVAFGGVRDHLFVEYAAIRGRRDGETFVVDRVRTQSSGGTRYLLNSLLSVGRPPPPPVNPWLLLE